MDDEHPPTCFAKLVVREILAEQAALEAALLDVIDLKPTDAAVLAYADRLHAQAERCIDFANRVRLALNARTN